MPQPKSRKIINVRIRFTKDELDKIRSAAQADERSVNKFVVRASVAAATQAQSAGK